MKNRWFVTALFALTLCACVTPARAAVVSGGTEYVWYTDMGRGEFNEDNQYVSWEGQKLYLSADQGGSYAELPGLREAQKLTGLSYAITVEPNAANDGGLSVKARDKWSSEYTWFRDYSAQEIAAALKNAVPIPVEVFATNGTVTVGTRYVNDWSNDDPTQPNYYGGNQGTGGYNGDRIVYSTDGVTWLPAEQEMGEYYSSIESGWWDGSAFHAGKYVSGDGIHWMNTEEEQVDPTFSLTCELGPYHFEWAANVDGETGVYLMDRTSPDTGVLLPHITEEAKAGGVSIGKLRAWYGPNNTVILAAYDIYSKESLMVSMDYPISSLDWCLANLRTQFRTIETVVTDSTMSLGMVDWDFQRGLYGWSQSRLACNDGSGWKWAENVPWENEAVPLFCEGGYFWVKGAEHRLYRSADGKNWLLSDAIRPADQKSGSNTYLNYQIAATDSGFIASRKGGIVRYGMFGSSGGGWFEGYSKVYLLDKNFDLVDSYDFGRWVRAVGWYDGTCYAQVANSDGHRDGWAGTDGVFSAAEGSTIYRSVDGKTWEKLPDIYVDMDDVMISTKGGSGVGNQPTNDPSKPLRMVARLDGYHFALKEIWGSGYTVGLMMGNAQDWMELDGMREAIQSHWILPGEVSVRYTADGGVEVTVTDLSTPGMTCSVTYSAAFLDESLKNGVRPENGVWDKYHIEEPEEEQSKPGVADVAVMAQLNGEKEIVYRTADIDGKYMYYNSVPWSNSVVLLPFSGKDFMVLDRVDGKVYLSADGVSWHEATGDWIVGNRTHNYWEYAFVWTGEHYLGVCMLADEIAGDGYKVVGHRNWARDNCAVILLDENLNYIRIANLDEYEFTTAVGCRDGVCYVQLGELLLESPNGGRGWMETDVLQVRECLRGLQ